MEALRARINEWLRSGARTQADLARASGVPQNVISKWVNRQVDQASADNLKKIAPTLGLTYEELLREMGEIPASGRPGNLDPIEQLIRARMAEMREAVRGTPQQFWATIINATFDRGIEDAERAKAMVEVLAASTEVTSSETAELTEQTSADNSDSERPQHDLPSWQVGYRVPALLPG